MIGRPGILSLIALLATPVSAAEPAITIAGEDAYFQPAVPTRPQAAQIAILRGEPTTGPSDMLMSMPRGDGRLHVHTSDYRLVVISGSMRHWTPDNGREKAKALGAGSYWFQPGGLAHADDCLSDQCLMFISWSGPRDAKVAD